MKEGDGSRGAVLLPERPVESLETYVASGGGRALAKALTGRSLGVTYYYRVKAVHPEYADSAWRTGAAGFWSSSASTGPVACARWPTRPFPRDSPGSSRRSRRAGSVSTRRRPPSAPGGARRPDAYSRQCSGIMLCTFAMPHRSAIQRSLYRPSL